jgi:hypothetical protein
MAWSLIKHSSNFAFAYENGNGEVFPVYAIKAYRKSRSTAPLILNLGAKRVVNIGPESGWTPQPFWMFWGPQKSLSPGSLKPGTIYTVH